MPERLAEIILPSLFLIVLEPGAFWFRRRKISQDGTPPIDRRVYILGKLSFVFCWGMMILYGAGVDVLAFRKPRALGVASTVLWALGFLLLYAGRINLGRSFRIGSADEKTTFRADGLYRLSRNPMYVGVDATVAAAALHTLNPIVAAAAIVGIAVHHQIVLGEERHLRAAFSEAYDAYRARVRRYL